jgi:protein-S-isoprenylcysteine O-methyltransferase Ste14
MDSSPMPGGRARLVGVGPLAMLAIFAFGALLFAALIFAPAGRLDWPAGWWCLTVMVIGFSAITAHVARRTPSLLWRRAKPGAGTPRWDLVLVSVFQLAFVAVLVVGALDAGRDRTRALPFGLEILGLLLMAAAMLGLGWAMGQNPHFEATIRIQHDQGHRVIESGPYRIVRHPGYAAGIPLLFGIALALGSARALVPALVGAIDLVVRTALEDRFLSRHLDGYRAFAQRTRFRLVPGVW